VFIAIDPDDTARRALSQLVRRVAHALPKARAVAPETLHLTLAFLGELNDEGVAEAIAAAGEVAASVGPFALATGHIGVFGPEHASRVIWVALGGELGRLHALQRRLTHALDTRGVPRDTKPFAPHLTLARLNASPDERAALQFIQLRNEPSRAASWQVDGIRVMRSDLAPTGARHTPLAIIPLGASA
jgi:2'-5' RNA ligase